MTSGYEPSVRLPLQRSRPQGRGIGVRGPDPLASTRFKAHVQRFKRSVDRTCCGVRSAPCDLRCFQLDPAGVLSTSSPRGSDPGGTPLCVLPVSSKRLPCNRTHERNVGAPLLGFCAPTARDETGYPYVPKRSPRSSWHRPSSGFLTHSTVFSTRSHARLSDIDFLAKAGASSQRSWGSL